jgi:tetratricopeptide (TPR) repeat protein
MSGTAAAAELTRARLLAAEGELSAALRLLDELLSAEPQDLPAMLLKGSVLLQLRQEQPALACYEGAAVLAPASAEARNGLARCLHAMARDDEALAAALQAKELLRRPENYAQAAPVFLTLVWVHRAQRRFQEALDCAQEGLARCPDAVLAQWASVVEEELEEAQQERC